MSFFSLLHRGRATEKAREQERERWVIKRYVLCFFVCAGRTSTSPPGSCWLAAVQHGSRPRARNGKRKRCANEMAGAVNAYIESRRYRERTKERYINECVCVYEYWMRIYARTWCAVAKGLDRPADVIGSPYPNIPHAAAVYLCPSMGGSVAPCWGWKRKKTPGEQNGGLSQREIDTK